MRGSESNMKEMTFHLQSYSAGLFQLPQSPAMPRSFLVKSKRTHLVGPPKVPSRQRFHHETNSNLSVKHGMWQDQRFPEDGGQSLFPMAEVKKPLLETYTPWDGMAVQSHSAPMDVWPWPSGNQ